MRKRLNEQFPNRFVDEGETPEHEISCSICEPQPEPEKPKPDIDKVFSHVQQVLMNDEDYFIIFGKHKDRIMIGIPVDVAEPKATTAENQKASDASLYRIMHSEV